MVGAAGASVLPAVEEAGGPGGEPVSEETLVLVDRQSMPTATLIPALRVRETE